MPADNRDSLLEARIDAALRSYTVPPVSITDPRTAAALILDRARRTSRPLWLWAIPAAACLLTLAVTIALWMHPTPSAPQIARAVSPPIAAPVPHPVAQTTPAQPARAIRSAHREHSNPKPLPELAVFPTPAPLSPQEKQLVAFVRNAPPAVKKAVVADQLQWNEPADAVSQLQPSNPGIPAAQLAQPIKENQ